MTNKEIGEKILTMRLSRNMSQAELAAAINMSPSSVAMYEAGKRRPRDSVTAALADVFNVPKWSILYSEEELKPQEPPRLTEAELAPDESQLVTDYRSLNPQGQEYIRQTMFVALPAYKKDPDLPLLADQAGPAEVG